MAKKSEFTDLEPIAGGRYDRFMKRRRERENLLPKDSNVYLTRITDIDGHDIENGSIVGIGDYIYNTGMNYAAVTNVGRNIPWIEDGLKSVERRILYILYYRGNKGSSNSRVASIVGSMIEKVYPHGDQSAADSIYRLGRSTSMMLPYIQAIGNYGNTKDMNPAAPRYAKGALTEYAERCFFKEIGPMYPLYDTRENYNYDDVEPIYLVSSYPNILMQWNLGIGNGVQTWLGAFNSSDILKATLTLMDDPAAKIDIYPDTPVPLDIINKAKLKGCFDRKKFKVVMRAPYYTETVKRRNSKDGREELVHTLVFTALPLGVIGDQIEAEVRELKNKGKRFQEIIDIRPLVDDGPGGVHVVIEYEHGYDPNVLAEALFHSTSLQKTVGVRYNVISDYTPTILTPREILLYWIDQRYDQKRRYYQQMATKSAMDRARYEAIGTVLETSKNTDKYLAIVRGSEKDEETIAKLQKAFGFTEFQCRVILDIKIRTLQKMDIQEVQKKREEAIENYKKYRKLLSSEKAIKDAVREELRDGLKRYGKPRMAKLKNLDEAEIGNPNDSKYLVYGSDYYYCFENPDDLLEIVPRIDNRHRMVQIRNGDGVLIFDRNGVLKVLNGYAFSLTTTGIAMATLGVSNVVSITTSNPGKGYDSVAMITEGGYGKLMELSEVMKSMKSRVITLNSEDKLAAVIPVRSDCHPDSIIGMFQDDRMYYLHVGDFPVLKRSSAGNRMVKNVEGLHINNAVYFDASDNPDYLLLYGESGHVKLLDMSFLTFSKRSNNAISMQGKRIVGATVLHGTEDDLELFMGRAKPCRMEVRVEIGKTVKFTVPETGQEQRFKMSTSIGASVKVLKVQKNEWYQLM